MAVYIIAAAALIIAAVFFFKHENNCLSESFHTVTSDRISEEIRLVHISDLHAKTFGRDNNILTERILSLHPDLICFTGDLINGRDKSRKSDIIGISLLARLAESVPVMHIPGNHESGENERTADVNKKLEEAQVTLLSFKIKNLKIKGNEISAGGVEELLSCVSCAPIIEKLSKNKGFRILLTHYPETFDMYSQYDIDLILAGHAHGGQFILPFVGGLYAPGQGIFPKYCMGLYEKSNTSMSVSRGLGSSRFPLRLFNRPEIVIIDLKPNNQ